MFDKVLIAGGILVGSVLIVENFVNSAGAYIFLDYGNTGFAVLISIFIGMAIGYGTRGKLSTKSYDDEDDYNF